MDSALFSHQASGEQLWRTIDAGSLIFREFPVPNPGRFLGLDQAGRNGSDPVSVLGRPGTGPEGDPKMDRIRRGFMDPDFRDTSDEETHPFFMAPTRRTA